MMRLGLTKKKQQQNKPKLNEGDRAWLAWKYEIMKMYNLKNDNEFWDWREDFAKRAYNLKAVNMCREKIKNAHYLNGLPPLTKSAYHCSVCGNQNNPFDKPNNLMEALLRSNICDDCQQRKYETVENID